MTYSEYRNQFPDAERFMRAYGKLNAEEAKALLMRKTRRRAQRLF